MENSPRSQERENPSPSLQAAAAAAAAAAASPKIPISNSSSGSSNSCNGVEETAAGAVPPLTPKTITRSETNPYPTTFIQADTSSFKQVVQMLTGSTETAAKHASAGSPADPPCKNPIPPAKKQQAFKLYERRSSSLKNIKLSPLMPGFLNSNCVIIGNGFSPRKQPEILSPSMLDFPSLSLSPVTPLIPDPFNRPPHPNSAAAMSAEDRAIAEKGFYLHPSPRTTPRDADPPRLLPLFPVTSPRISSGTSPATY